MPLPGYNTAAQYPRAAMANDRVAEPDQQRGPNQAIRNQAREKRLLAVGTGVLIGFGYLYYKHKMAVAQAFGQLAAPIPAGVPAAIPAINSSTAVEVTPPADSEIVALFNEYVATAGILSHAAYAVIRRLAEANNFDPNAMFNATEGVLQQQCNSLFVNINRFPVDDVLGDAAKQLSELGMKVQINQADIAEPLTLADYPSLSINVGADLFKQLSSSTQEAVCKTALLNETKRVFTRFVELANQGLNDLAIFSKLITENVLSMIGVKEMVAKQAFNTAVSCGGVTFHANALLSPDVPEDMNAFDVAATAAVTLRPRA